MICGEIVVGLRLTLGYFAASTAQTVRYIAVSLL
jgi:hypothetical protein